MVNWNVPISKRLNDAVEQAVKDGYAVTKSEFIRQVVQEKINSIIQK